MSHRAQPYIANWSILSSSPNLSASFDNTYPVYLLVTHLKFDFQDTEVVL